ncbi:MAG: GIY-YIG nuclease family protein [bacterium]|nr:GIY-YIG nuclease family protein [bacterium]
MNLLSQAKKLPLSSGVYLFLDRKNKPLYIGRATSLKRRVISYFQKPLDSRLAEMLNSAVKIRHYKTDSVLEAIILEANLIKKYWPKYNVREKDNRSFVYIVIPKTDYARPFIVRRRELQKFPQDRVFGPYQSLHLIKTGLRLIRKIFPYSTCRINSGKPCFDYQIGLCPGVCAGKISKDDYKKNIDNIILFLKGEKRKLLKKLKKENPEAIQSLKHIQDVALISREETSQIFFLRIEGYDISHLTGKETVGSMVVFTNGAADNSQYRLFKIREAPANDDLRALEEMIARRFNHPEWPMPNLILIDGGKPQIDYISKVLKKRNIAIPLVGISKYIGTASPKAGEPRPDLSGRDKLVFPPKIKHSIKELIQSSKAVLLKVRNEAHRFALKTSRRQRKLSAK